MDRTTAKHRAYCFRLAEADCLHQAVWFFDHVPLYILHIVL